MKLNPYEVLMITPEDVQHGVTKGEIMYLAELAAPEIGLFIRTHDDEDGIPLEINQVRQRPDLPDLDFSLPADVPVEIVESALAQLPLPLDEPVFENDLYAQAELGAPVEDKRDTDANPKDIVGQAKADLSLIPGTALVHEAHAMMDGAVKYGPYNWRTKKVKARIYIAAALRHIQQWMDGEEQAEDSLAHHLGHARACLGILIDAQVANKLVDDRPPTVGISAVLKHVNKLILEKQ